MKTIVIDGLGLIGGSIALAIRKTWPNHRILAVDVNQSTLEQAKKQQAIDGGSTRLQDIAAEADIIILAAPVSVILNHLNQMSGLNLKPGVIVTDVGSTKKQIIVRAHLLIRKGLIFIGGHPMAGSHKSSFSAARADLFQSAYYFLISDTITDRRCRSAVKQLQVLLSGLDVKWQTVSAEQHDRIVAQISHLPHVLAAGLVNMAQDAFSHSPLSLKLAAGGFRSMTRIASSDPRMWTDILLSNGDIMIDKIDQFEHYLQHIRQAVISSDRDTIQSCFSQAKVTRDRLNARAGVYTPGFYDLLINLPDKSGEIAKITHILADAGINLMNIHILEIREEIDGILQLSFYEHNDLIQARKELRRNGLSVIEVNP